MVGLSRIVRRTVGALHVRLESRIVTLRALVALASWMLLLSASLAPVTPAAHAQGTSAVWASYLFDSLRGGFNASESVITTATAPNLKLHWQVRGTSRISTQPITDNNLIYWGSWDGFEHATSLTGTPVWATNLGQTLNQCNHLLTGVTSTATSLAVNGQPMLFVGGGNKQVYALNALTGAVIWQQPVGNYLWSSPLVANGSVYIGTASLGDCPNIHGQLLQLDAATGAILHTFDVVPLGCTGGSIWGSPTVDPVANLLYVATGNPGTCGTTEHGAEAVIQINPATLTAVASWQVPSSQRTSDGDFGSTPTLFAATIGGARHTLVGVANKNGRYYALDTANIAHGPVWQDKIAIGGSGPEKGQGSISPSAWDGTNLYIAGGNTTINALSCKGSLRAVNPATGAYIWQDCLGAPVLAAVSAVPGVAVVDAGTLLTLVATATGSKLFTFSDAASGSHFWGAASVAGGVIYQGNMDGKLYAIGT